MARWALHVLRVPLLTAAALLAASGAARGHDIWLAPEPRRPAPGDTLVVRQLVGDALEVELELAFLPDLTRGFRLFTPDGVVELASEPRESPRPLLRRRLTSSGPFLLALEHDFSTAELDNATFLEYIEGEGFDKARFTAALSERPRQRERYARSLKCLMGAGGRDSDALHRRILGQRLEILLLEDPRTLAPGDTIPVRVLLEGAPLAGAPVAVLQRDPRDGIVSERARTAASGVARLRLARPGLQVIRLVHLRPCAAPSACSDLEWESFWAAYSFVLEERDGGAAHGSPVASGSAPAQ